MMLTRRQMLITGAATLAAGTLGIASRAHASTTVLRPPGALPPGDFERTCIRCFRCAEVCPPQCIRLDTLLSLRDADLPAIHPGDKGCTLCMRCGPVCPTGALVAIAVVDVASKVRMGTPALDTTTCRPYNGKPCRLCFDVCPFAGSAVVLDKRLAPVFDAAHCVGCGMCEEACPVDDKAIRILPPKERA